jgi:hypothetical protein
MQNITINAWNDFGAHMAHTQFWSNNSLCVFIEPSSARTPPLGLCPFERFWVASNDRAPITNSHNWVTLQEMAHNNVQFYRVVLEFWLFVVFKELEENGYNFSLAGSERTIWIQSRRRDIPVWIHTAREEDTLVVEDTHGLSQLHYSDPEFVWDQESHWLYRPP